MNLCEKVFVGEIRDVNPESNISPAFGVFGIPDVTVCIVLWLLIHVIVLLC